MDFLDEDCYNMSRLIVTPFLIEIKEILKRSKRYLYVEDEDKMMDYKKTKSIVLIDGTEDLEIIEKYPIITVSRSAVQILKPNINSMPMNSMLGDDVWVFGDAFNCNVNIKVECHSQSDSERCGSFLFNLLRINCKRMATKYGVTDYSFNYLSQPIPVKGANDEKVDAWQVGINCVMRVDEAINILDGETIKEINKEWNFTSGIKCEEIFESF